MNIELTINVKNSVAYKFIRAYNQYQRNLEMYVDMVENGYDIQGGRSVMYVIFRCDCGRVLYTKDYKKTKKCPSCNKTLKVKQRRLLGESENIDDVIAYVQQEQDRIYHNTDFTTADNIKR